MQIQIRSADEPSTTFYKCVFGRLLLRGTGCDRLPGCPELTALCGPGFDSHRCCNMECNHQWREN